MSQHMWMGAGYAAEGVIIAYPKPKSMRTILGTKRMAHMGWQSGRMLVRLEVPVETGAAEAIWLSRPTP